MTKALTWFMELVMALLPLILKAEEGGGSDKKAKVVNEVIEALKDPNVPFNMPAFISEGMLRWILGIVIDLLVAQLNKYGFFVK